MMATPLLYRIIAPITTIAVILVLSATTTLVSAQTTVAKCTNAAFTETFCPYGYTTAMVADAGSQVATTPTIELCCDRDNGIAAFPICTAPAAGGSGAVQAADSDDTNWAVQDSNGFARSVGQFTGMCFSVTINNDCSLGSPAVASKCCAKKAPSFIQFKLPAPTGLVAGSLRATTLADDSLKLCKISYGAASGSAASLKRVTKWNVIGSTATGAAEFINIPVAWRRGQKQATVCIYSNYFNNDVDVDCSWENLCGFLDGTVPTESGSFDKGCELRIIGRKGPLTSPCCAPTYSVQSFDANDESRLAAAGAAGGATSSIELLGQ